MSSPAVRAAPDAGGSGPLPPGWHRLHPASPALRSWKLLVVLLFFYAQNRGRNLLSDDGSAPGLRELLIALAVLVLVLVVATAGGVASWWFSRWALDDESVRLHSGVLARQQRSARLDRVQAVDLVRPPVARVFGFAEVRVEVAGGSGSAIRLAYLRLADAEALQAALLERAQQAVAEESGQAVEAPGHDPGAERDADAVPEADAAARTGEDLAPLAPRPPSADAVPRASPGAGAGALAARPVLTVAFPRLLGSVALTTLPPFVVVTVASAVVLGLSGSFATAYGTVPLLLGLGATVWRDLSRGGAWTVESTASGLRLRHGLLERRTQSIPRGRVQAVRVHQPPLWRLTGWWRLEVNVAGYGSEGDAGTSTRVVPVCSRAQVDELLALVLPVEVAGSDVQAGLVGASAEGRTAGAGSPDSAAAWTCSPRRARWLDPFAWRRQGALAADEVLLLRHGRLARTLDVVPHGRTQSIALSQGPWQRRLGLTTLVVHSTPGPVSPVAPHLDAGVAAALLLAQAGRAEAAMAREDAPGPAGPADPVSLVKAVRTP